MKYLCLISALIFALWGGAVEAEETKGKDALSGTAVTEENQSGKIKHLDIEDTSGDVNEEEYGAGSQQFMPAGEANDQNTGLPNVVPSDTAGEIE